MVTGRLTWVHTKQADPLDNEWNAEKLDGSKYCISYDTEDGLIIFNVTYTGKLPSKRYPIVLQGSPCKTFGEAYTLAENHYKNLL